MTFEEDIRIVVEHVSDTELATQLNVSSSTVWGWARRGSIPRSTRVRERIADIAFTLRTTTPEPRPSKRQKVEVSRAEISKPDISREIAQRQYEARVLRNLERRIIEREEREQERQREIEYEDTTENLEPYYEEETETETVIQDPSESLADVSEDYERETEDDIDEYEEDVVETSRETYKQEEQERYETDHETAIECDQSNRGDLIDIEVSNGFATLEFIGWDYEFECCKVITVTFSEDAYWNIDDLDAYVGEILDRMGY